MKEAIHPEWYPEATVVCECGNSWTTGATVPEIRTDICSACHPFFTGEQRIVDTEGQVDRFMKRLQVRDQMMADADARATSRIPLDLPLTELNISKRYLTILNESNIKVVSDFLTQLEGGESNVLEIPGIGRKVLADIKKMLVARGYDVPGAANQEEEATETAEE